MLTPVHDYDALIRTFTWHIPRQYNIGVDVCDKWANIQPRKLALIHKDHDGKLRFFTFGDIRDLSNQTANMLSSFGLVRGDRVAVMLPQSPETAYSHVAIYKMGCIAIPLSTLFGIDAIRYRLADSQTRAIITNAAGAAKLATLRGQLTFLEFAFSIETTSGDCIDFHKERAKHSATYHPVETTADEPALIIYTSGTTGPPKEHCTRTAFCSGTCQASRCRTIFSLSPVTACGRRPTGRGLAGYIDVLMPSWHHGIAVVSHKFEKFDPEGAFQLMADLQVRNVFLPPTALKMMRSLNSPAKRWHFKLRTIASGGETLGTELLDWGRQTFGLTINEFYGQTECNMIVSNCTTIMPGRPGLMGRSVPGHRVAIMGNSGQPLPSGQAGQIAVARPDPVMFLEYWRDPESTRKKFSGDWLLTGDVGVMDVDGNIRFLGRNDDVINSAGYRIGPGEIEDCLLKHHAVRMAAVIGVPDETRNEIVKAYIVLAEGLEADPSLKESISDFVKTQLSAHEYPREIAFVNQLPLTTTGKIMRRTLREWNVLGVA